MSDIDRQNYYATGETILHECIRTSDIEVVEHVLDFEDSTEERNINGQTPLHYAVLFNRTDVIPMLIERGADINAEDIEGKTPFDYNQELMDNFLGGGVATKSAKK